MRTPLATIGPMVRFAVLAVIAVAVAGCDPGSLYDGPITDGDGGVVLCEPEEAVNGDGHHNGGTGCLTAGCHRAGGGPAFTVAGTMYDTSRSGSPIGGATVVIIDGDGNRFDLITAANGNFYTSEPVVFPLLAKASLCPSDNKMVSLSQTGDCNSQGCHGVTDIRVALSGR
jgi:hypothetical protein